MFSDAAASAAPAAGGKVMNRRHQSMSAAGPGQVTRHKVVSRPTNDPPSLPPKTRGTPRLPPKPLDQANHVVGVRPQHNSKRPLPPLPPPRVPPPPPPMPK